MHSLDQVEAENGKIGFRIAKTFGDAFIQVTIN